MNLQPRKEKVQMDGREFLKTTTGLEYKTAGITLDADKFTGDYINGGTAVMRGPQGLFVPAGDGGAEGNDAIEGACLTAHSVKRVPGSKPIVGAITKCYARKDRCTGVTDAFVAEVKNRIIFDL